MTDAEDFSKNKMMEFFFSVSRMNEFYLAYWQNQSDRNLGVKPIRIIPIATGFSVARQQPPCFQDKFCHVIALDTTERKYFFCTRNDAMMTSWFEFLSHAIDAVALETQAIKQVFLFFHSF